MTIYLIAERVRGTFTGVNTHRAYKDRLEAEDAAILKTKNSPDACTYHVIPVQVY